MEKKQRMSWLKRKKPGLSLWSLVWRVLAIVTLLAAGGIFFLLHYPYSQIPQVENLSNTVYLDQGWGETADSIGRQTYYYTPQGTGDVLKHMRYSWFVNLERPWGKEKFAAPGHMRAYGFLVDDTPTAQNPDLLPVGFTRHFNRQLGEEILDITCSACHTGALQIKNGDGSLTSVRIDGGQAMHAFTASEIGHFVPVLIGAMASTYLNPIKFDRFAEAVLGENHRQDDRAALRREFRRTLSELLEKGATQLKYGLSPHEEGYGRTDALTRIGNAVYGDHISAKNYKVINAPVSYPPVWDVWKFDWVQYSASVAQPMARNIGESLGVGASYDFFDSHGRPLEESLHYYTSTRIKNLHKIEQTLQSLRPPVWPEDILGRIDRKKAAAGGIAFIRTCQGCHGPHPASAEQRAVEMPLKSPNQPHWKLTTLNVEEIGSDPTAAINFVERTFDLRDTGMNIEVIQGLVGDEIKKRNQRILKFEFPDKHISCQQPPEPETGTEPERTTDCAHWQARNDELVRELDDSLKAINLAATTNGQGLNYVGLLMKRKLYEKYGFSEEKIREINGFDALDLPQVKKVYKARPLGGAWATAPYLHNGSVRTLYQLLSPQHQRDEKFLTGNVSFDPIQVGITPGTGNGIMLDTRVTGNANTGHEFRDGYTDWKPGSPPQYGVIGPAYTEEQRYEIIEYLKSHLDDPPLSSLYEDVLEEIVGRVYDDLAVIHSPDKVATLWPQGQACNLREYMANHLPADSLKADVKHRMQEIIDIVDAYLVSPQSYQCGGKTRYQRGG